MFDFEPPVRAMFLTDGDGTIAGWNEACATLFGLASAAVLGQPATILFACNAQVWQDALQLADNAQGRVLWAELRGAEGRTLHANLALASQLDGAGALRGLAVAVHVAVTAHAGDDAVPESVRVAQTPLALVVDLFPGTFYAINRDGRFVLWNHNMERMMELAPDELAATRAVDLLDLSQRPLLAAGMRRVFENGEELQLEVEYVSKSGREIPFLLHGTRIRCNGDDYLFGLGLDIT